jgi:hypothetical protein
MRYFYDHQTDVLTIGVGDLADYDASVELVGGVVLHLDAMGRPLVVEIREARSMVDTAALKSFEEHAIGGAELERRLSASDPGRHVWTVISPHAAPAAL